MNGETVRVLVLSGHGINCEEETAAAYRLAGAVPEIVHLNALLEGHSTLTEYRVLHLPGGFSFGDDLGAGKALANRIRYKQLSNGRTLFDDLLAFIDAGNFILGICNGFQVLAHLGLVPNTDGRHEQEVTLAPNDSGRFEDRWCTCSATSDARTPFVRDLDIVALPVRHGEGKLLIRDENVRSAILAGSYVAMTYCNADGQAATTYPENPNGSDLACAGLSDDTGRVLGMMPHPEAYLSAYNHPAWPHHRRARGRGFTEEGEGLRIFRNVVEAARDCPVEAGIGSRVSGGEEGPPAR
jgi:phosphoribosylformylglycinamidine synthase